MPALNDGYNGRVMEQDTDVALVHSLCVTERERGCG